MSDKLPSKEQLKQLLVKTGCPQNVVRHCEAVAKLAVEMAETLQRKGFKVDVRLVETGALLHDLGRSKTHSVHHGVVGGEIAKSLGFPDSVLSIIRRHVGGGITSDEAKKFGWPEGIYVPQTLEEKIVSYADKLIEGQRQISIEKTLNSFARELPPEAVERVRKLDKEMSALLGDS